MGMWQPAPCVIDSLSRAKLVLLTPTDHFANHNAICDLAGAGAPYLTAAEQRHTMAKSFVNHLTLERFIAGLRAGAIWFCTKAGAFRPGELREKRVRLEEQC